MYICVGFSVSVNEFCVFTCACCYIYVCVYIYVYIYTYNIIFLSP